MKTKLIALAVAASFSLGASAAFADDAYQGSWYAVPSIGYMFTDSDLKADNDIAAGLRIGKELSEHWDVQLGLSHSRADEDSNLYTSGKYKQTLLGLDAMYMFSRDKLRPFLSAGLGLANNRVGYTGAGNPSGSNTSWMANVGAGIQYFFTDNVALQADVRHVWSRADENTRTLFGSSDSTIGNTYLNLGLLFNFGAPKQTAAAPAEQPMASNLADIAPQDDEALPPLMEGEQVAAEPVGPAPAAFEKMTLQAEVLFAFDKDVLKDVGKQLLNVEVVDKMRAHPEVELVLITGHTDRIGDDNYNQKLSERRAAQVKRYIASQGIDASRLHAVGKGEKEPVADCKGVRGKKLIACLQPNRRVVVEIEAQRQVAQ